MSAILRKSSDRGHAEHGWLKSFHSFSFADYMDPRHMGHGNLRVINEDFIAAGQGFGTHGHRDMEIVTYVMHGELSHKDSMGNASRILPGEVQRMSAGRGVRHSEFNPSPDERTHLLQIWLLPNAQGIEPEYEQKRFDIAHQPGRLVCLASSDGREGSLHMRSDAVLWAGLFDAGATAALSLAPGRKGYVHVVRGRLQVNGQTLGAGDALVLQDEPDIGLSEGQDAEVLVFDLAP